MVCTEFYVISHLLGNRWFLVVLLLNIVFTTSEFEYYNLLLSFIELNLKTDECLSNLHKFKKAALFGNGR